MKEFKKRFQLAKEDKTIWQSHYDAVMTYIRPSRKKYVSKDSRSEDYIADSIGEVNANTAVNSLMSTLTPPNKVWAKLVKPEGRDLLISDSVLDKATRILFSYINSSNIYSELSSSFLDLVAGTGAF